MNIFDQPVKNGKMTNENISKIATGEGDDYTTACLLVYHYSPKKKNYKMIAIGVSKQQAIDADPEGIRQINFTIRLVRIVDY